MRDLTRLLRLFCWALVISAASQRIGAPQSQPASVVDPNAVSEALRWLKATPRFSAEYNFELTVDIRLLVFWTSKDDVGGGYIKLGPAQSDPSLEIVRLLFGSDPARAHGVNRWGAGTEVVKLEPGGSVTSSAFVGFMKSSQGDSAGKMQQEVARENQAGQHRFEAIISLVGAGHAVSTTVPFYSDHDFDFRQLEPAEQTVLQQIQDGQSRQYHALDDKNFACDRRNGFLSTVQALDDAALQGLPTPTALCYVYNSKGYTLTLDSARPVAQKTVRFSLANTKVERKYNDLKEAKFHVLNHVTGKKTYFTLLLGTSGDLRGAPVQIEYQPNWWFRITLNLLPPAAKTTNAP